MSRYYTVSNLSENIKETPEGYLVCEGVAIARAGDLLYAEGETGVQAADNGLVVISRTIEDIGNKETLASYEGKPIVISHPDDGILVNPENVKEFIVGVVQNPRVGIGEDSDKVLADFLIMDSGAIDAVKKRRLRSVSCGYTHRLIQTGVGKGKQTGIRGNHIALVESGRCGDECAIFDSAKNLEGESMTVKEKIKTIFGRSLDEAMPDEKKNTSKDEAMPDEKKNTSKDEGEGTDIAMMLAKLSLRMDALETSLAGKEEEDDVVDITSDEEPLQDVEGMMSDSDRLAKIEAMLASLVGKQTSTDEYDETVVSLDSDVISRAEILSPGIGKVKDVKKKSLASAYKTEDGKKAIDSVLSGKSFDSADKDLLFMAASEVLKSMRRDSVASTRQVSLDSTSSCRMTPAKLNEINAKRYETN